MSKMSTLANELEELKKCGQVLIGISESLSDLFSDGNPPEPGQQSENNGDEERKTKNEEQSKPLELEDVRAVLADKSRKGHTAEVKALLKKYGATKLSAIDPGKYSKLLGDAEAIK